MENDNGKTLWKKKLFSDNQIPKDDDFQTLNMIHKIKKVNSKKEKRKKQFNYKNIEKIENIHEEEKKLKEEYVDGSHSGDRKDDGTWKDSLGNTERGYFDNTDGSYWIIDANGNKTKYDGPMDPDSGIPLTPDFWEGLDSGDYGLSADDPRLRLLKFIDSIEDGIEHFNQSIAEHIANGLQQTIPIPINTIVTKGSNILILKKNTDKNTANNINNAFFSGVNVQKNFVVKGTGIPSTATKTITVVSIQSSSHITISENATESGEFVLNYYEDAATLNDVSVIRKFVSLILSAIMSFIFSYNLIYILFCTENNTKVVNFPKLKSDTLKNLTLDELFGMPMQVLVFFFTYSLYFTDILQLVFIEKLPIYTKMYLNVPLFFLASFAGMIYVIEKFMPIFLGFLRDVIMLNTDNYYVNMMYAAVIFFFTYDCFVLIHNFKTIKYSITNIMRLL